jgi:hypothetical protein
VKLPTTHMQGMKHCLVSSLCYIKVNISLCILCNRKKKRGRISTFAYGCFIFDEVTENRFLACCELIFYS